MEKPVRISDLNRTEEPKKIPPLTTDDILDIHSWSKEVKHHELSYLDWIKTKA